MVRESALSRMLTSQDGRMWHCRAQLSPEQLVLMGLYSAVQPSAHPHTGGCQLCWTEFPCHRGHLGLRSLINPPFFSPLPVSRAPLGLEGRHLLVPPTEVHLIDYMQIAVHVHATIKLLLVPVGVTDTECIRIVPELTSTQNGRAEPAAAQWKPSQQELAAGHTSPPSWPSSLCVGRAYPRLCCCRVSAPLCIVVGYCNLT